MTTEVAKSIAKLDKKIAGVDPGDVSRLPAKIEALKEAMTAESEKRNEASNALDEQIKELERQLVTIRDARKTIRQPYDNKINELSTEKSKHEYAIRQHEVLNGEIKTLETFRKVLELLDDGWHILWVKGRNVRGDWRDYYLGGGGHNNYRGHWKFIGITANHLGFLVRSSIGKKNFNKAIDPLKQGYSSMPWECCLVKTLPAKADPNWNKPNLYLQPGDAQNHTSTRDHPYYNDEQIPGITDDPEPGSQYRRSVYGVATHRCPLCKKGLRWMRTKRVKVTVYSYWNEPSRPAEQSCAIIDKTKPAIDTPDHCTCPQVYGITWNHDFENANVPAIYIKANGTVDENSYPTKRATTVE